MLGVTAGLPPVFEQNSRAEALFVVAGWNKGQTGLKN